MNQSDSSVEISVIAPLYNEEESVTLLHEYITNAIAPVGVSYEILFVDDGSKDTTFETARAIAEKDKNLRVIKFRQNYGQTPAMAAGIDHARGKILITMDGDLQNDPRDIPEFLKKIDEGYDIVVGWRHKRQDKLITRKIPSKIANWIIGKVTGVPIRDNGCSLKAFRADVIKSVPLYSEMHRFIPAMASLAGTRVAEIKVRHHARQFGESKYGLSRIYKVLLDLLTIKTIVSFSSRPLHWFGLLALPLMLVGILAFVIALFDLAVNEGSSPVVMLGISVVWMVSSIFMVLTGALGELIFKTGNIKFDLLSSLTTKTVGKNRINEIITDKRQ